MRALYLSTPLLTQNGESRLITILPKSLTSTRIECEMQKCCLTDTRLEYDTFAKDGSYCCGAKGQPSAPLNGSNLDRHTYSHSELLPAWYALQKHTPRSKPDAIKAPRYPENVAFRFRWGDFAALSYVWGDPNITQPILVNNQEVQITRNLHCALDVMRGLGHFSGRFRLWVDALCIDQSNNGERTDQVAEMGRFYSTAWTVVAFLGPEDQDSSKAIDLVEDLASYHGRQGACERLEDELMRSQGYHDRGSCLALNQLTLRRYWERPCIIQEICLGASRTVLFAGSRSIDWQRFCHGIEVVHLHLWVAKNACVARDRRAISPADTKTWETTGPLHHIWKDLWALSQTEKLKDKPFTFSRLLEVANFSSSYDPRDKIYGLLGLMPPGLATRIVPDYALDAATSFIRVATLLGWRRDEGEGCSIERARQSDYIQ
jgi:hypothetical protein